jgi:hypothetical protein
MLTASAGTDLSQPSASSSLLLVPGAVPATTRDHVPPSQGTDEAEEHAKKRKEKGKHKEVESAATVSHPGCAPAVEIKVPAEATISVQPPIATPHGAKVQVEIDEPGKEPLEIDVFIPPLESRVRPGELPAPLPIPLSEPAPEPVHAERKAEQEAVDASSVVPEASVIPESMNEDALSEMSGADAAEVAAKKKKKKDKKGKGGPEEGEGEDAFVPRFPNAKTVLLIRHGEFDGNKRRNNRLLFLLLCRRETTVGRGRLGKLEPERLRASRVPGTHSRIHIRRRDHPDGPSACFETTSHRAHLRSRTQRRTTATPDVADRHALEQKDRYARRHPVCHRRPGKRGRDHRDRV